MGTELFFINHVDNMSDKTFNTVLQKLQNSSLRLCSLAPLREKLLNHHIYHLPLHKNKFLQRFTLHPFMNEFVVECDLLNLFWCGI
ncbi:MAG: hypothetical protein JWQ30_1635 [Sediminibacterium sp.]|nr:hypothetical protein [Sediminibacterium sp.]